ncbi:MAG: hypothetical protein ABIC57_00925 [bacterium]
MDEKDITEKTKIKWSGGYVAAELHCECGEKIIAVTSMPSICSCGNQYWIACRVIKGIEKELPDHGCECRCIECDLARAKYQAKFEAEHDN